MRYLFLISLFIFLLPLFAYAKTQELYPFKSEHQAAQFNALTKQIRCVVCQNQSIADSNALLAEDLRDKVYQLVLAKKSNQEIETFLRERYGEFILLKPRFTKTTLLLWSFPLLAVFLALIWLHRKTTKYMI